MNELVDRFNIRIIWVPKDSGLALPISYRMNCGNPIANLWPSARMIWYRLNEKPIGLRKLIWALTVS